MDEQRFDQFAKLLAQGRSRRGALGVVSGALGAGVLAAFGRRATAQEGCAEGLTLCGGVCVDLASSSFNCGACGQQCFGGDQTGGVCVGGVCSACGPGLTACYDAPDSYCADLLNDARNCGVCGLVCTSGACIGGTCSTEPAPAGCAEGETDCGAYCTVVATDPDNCGACGVVCPEGVACVAGVCQAGQEECGEGLTDCGGYCADLANADDNCGACGVVCPSGTVCLAGVCDEPDAAAVEATATVSPSPTAEATAEPTAAGETIEDEAEATPSPTPSSETVAGEALEGTPPAAATTDEADATATPEPEPEPTETPQADLDEAAAETAVAQEAEPRRICPATSEEENEELALRWFEALADDDLDALRAVLADDVILHAANLDDAADPDEVVESLATLLEGFPDVRFRVDQAITDEDHVVLRWTATGTHDGEFRGRPATGREATWTGINIFRIECGRIAEVWSEVDGLALLRQIGVLREATPTP